MKIMQATGLPNL